MNIVTIDEITVYGLTTRTNNANEAIPEQSKIYKTWMDLGSELKNLIAEKKYVYGIYTEYESNENGEYTFLAGSDALKDKSHNYSHIKIEGGAYMVFKAQGNMPEELINCWKAVWSHFASGDSEYVRKFTTDFEFYRKPDEVEIHIAVEKK